MVIARSAASVERVRSRLSITASARSAVASVDGPSSSFSRAGEGMQRASVGCEGRARGNAEGKRERCCRRRTGGGGGGVFVELVRGAPPLAAASDVHGPKMSGATALTLSHGTSPSGTPTLSVISTSPLALAAATTTTLLAAQAAVEPGLPRGDQPLDEHLFSRRSSSIPRVSGASSFTFGLIPSAFTRSAG